MLINKNITRSMRQTLVRKAPTILSGLGILGVYTTAIFASKATLKANDVVNEENMRRYEGRSNVSEFFMTKKEIVKATWKEYIPTLLISLATCACIVKSGRIHSKRHAALMALYSLSETAFREYQGKVKDMIGDGKDGKIRDSIAKDRITKQPATEIIVTGTGETLCFDAPSGRYFQSSIEIIRRKENNFNQTLRTEMSLTLNELYYELGLNATKTGDYMGWDIEKGLLSFKFSSQLNEHGQPCLVIDYDIHPLFDR